MFAFLSKKYNYIKGGFNVAGKNTVSAVWEIVEPYVIQLGLQLWDVRFVKEGACWYLRIFIDSENGITIEDCENVSRAIDEPLDIADPIDKSYCLEVSSPGVERELTRPEHFEQFMGADVMVKMIRPLEGIGKEFKGVLTSADKLNCTVSTDKGEVIFNKKDTVWVRLDDFNM